MAEGNRKAHHVSNVMGFLFAQNVLHQRFSSNKNSSTLKLAKELTKASASQKAIGQIESYTKQFK